MSFDDALTIMQSQIASYLRTIYALRPDLRRDDWCVALYREDGLLMSMWATYLGMTHERL